MDYEPGHMRNAQKAAFRVLGAQPVSQGTRMHQAAMYVVYESPWAKMGGNVSDYFREPEFTTFLASIPTLWEETRVLDGVVGDYVVTERVAEDGDVWVGAMTDWTAREVPLDLAFLGDGRWEMEVFADGPNADRYGADWRREARQVTAADHLTIRMAPGGGWVARFTRDQAATLEAAVRREGTAEEEHLEALYEVARRHALLGHRDEACEALERLGQAGLFDVSRARKDEAFAALREDDRYRKAVRAIWFRGYLWLLERPERDVYQKPGQVMAALAFRPGERVADIGAGSGYFSRRISGAVGPTGVVWAIDIAPEVLEYLEARARREGLTNIRIQRVSPDDPKLPPEGVDTILMVDTLHYVKGSDRGAYAKKLRAALAPGGRVVVIDFLPKPLQERPWGPPPEQKMSREEVDAAMAEAGLVPARAHDFLTEQFFVEYRPK
jgi:2-polyprenyl-3-methyl-5-hydroxy-6-metoxy-1,4-benzoquinol methylase